MKHWKSITDRAQQTTRRRWKTAMILARWAVVSAWLLSLCHPEVARAGLGNFFKSVGDVAVKTVTAPAQTVVNATRAATGNAPASTIFDPAKNLAGDHGRALSEATKLAAAPKEEIYKQAQKAIGKTGPAGEFVFDVSTFADRFQEDFHRTTQQTVANILQGKNILQLVSAPLAAAIREARERHITSARPLPEDVKEGLAGMFDTSVLQRARWTVGSVEITLPNGLGRTRRFFGDDYAVVVDEVIVFNREPPAFRDDPFWWGHEVTHVQQYKELGIDDFARKYVFSGGADLENPADAKGRRVVEAASNSGLATRKALAVRVPERAESRPLYPKKVEIENDPGDGGMPPIGPQTDPAVIECVFPFDRRPFAYFGTRAGRIIVVDRTNNQWMHIGFALPRQLPQVAWQYSAGGVFYDVFPNGDIVQRITPTGPQKIGHVVRLGN